MKLTVIIPSFNEADTIGGVVDRIPKIIHGIDEVQVIVIDDGSTDQTAQLAQQAGAIVISHSRNRGVGSAFNTGLTKALEMGADIMVNIDADGQFSPDEIPKLIEPILAGEADFVPGDRFIQENQHIRRPALMSKLKYWGNWCMARLISRLSNQDFKDVSCGFRAYSREAMLWLNLTGKFTYTQESFLDFTYKGLEIKSVPVSVRYFPDRQSKVAGNLFEYMLRTLKIITRAYRDYSPLRFFGWLGLLPFVFGLGCGIFMLIHYIRTSGFSPYKFVGFAGIYLGSLAILLWIVGLLADMFRRIRSNQEKLLYFEKKRRFNKE
jgi:glycosyltransferase involved in cell wall biosynthesis